MNSPIFVVISIVTVLTFVESKAIENGISVNDSNGIPTANNNNNNLTNTENIVSRETINHVQHQHHQQIGNLQIITEIDIKNLVSILNTSAMAMPNDPKQSGNAILTAGEQENLIYFGNWKQSQLFVNELTVVCHKPRMLFTIHIISNAFGIWNIEYWFIYHSYISVVFGSYQIQHSNCNYCFIHL